MSNLNWKIKKWQEEARIKELNKYKGNKCGICENRGFVIDNRVIEGNEYKYSLHCECVHGNKWKGIMDSYKRYYSEAELNNDNVEEVEEPCPF